MLTPIRKPDLLVLLHSRLILGKHLLDCGRAFDRLNGTRKHGKYAVTGELHDASAVSCDLGLHDSLAEITDPGMGSGLVSSHKPAVADDIGSENGSEPSLGPMLTHAGYLSDERATTILRYAFWVSKNACWVTIR